MQGGSPGFDLDLRWMRRSFDRAAPGFDSAAVLHARVRETLLGRLAFTTLEPRAVLDAGAGTAHACRALKRRYPKARVIALDSSLGMLSVAARQRSWLRPFDRVCADAHSLPLADGTMDLIISNLMLPYCDPDRVFAEFRRVLAPRGLLSFSSLGPDTLKELRSSWAGLDAHSHVIPFIDMHDLGDALVRSGFAAPVLDVDTYTLTYSDIGGLMTDLKSLGAHNVMIGRARGLTGRRKFAAMREAYEGRRRDGRLPATAEVVFGHAWAPAEPRAAPRGDREEAAVSLAEITRLLPSKRKP
jgi:malonyl-CoA O-methyltransferase